MKTDAATNERDSRINPLRSISVYIIATTCVMFLVMSGIFLYISYQIYRDAFYNYSNDYCQATNAMAALIIDGDMVERFAKTLTVDDDYRRFAAKLDQLKENTNIKYLYILVDNDVPGMYTYIYDATHWEEFPGELYALGRNETIAEFTGADEVLKNGKPFEKAEYYNDYYGELYYSYAPIFNSHGGIVGFVGSDIDISPLHTRMTHFHYIIAATLLLAFIIFLVVCVLVVREVLTIPLHFISNGAFRMSRGDLHFKLPADLVAQQNEIGKLGRAFESVSRSISGVIIDIRHIFAAIREGRLDERGSLSEYQGDFHGIIEGVNATLGVVCRHFDALPEAVAFFDPDMRLLYCNRAMHELLALHGLDIESDFLLIILSSGDNVWDIGDDFQALLSRDKSVSIHKDIALQTASGETRDYSLALFHTESDQTQTGDMVSNSPLMMLLSDVTPLARAKNEALLASRAKSDFLSRMSHEIRTPMNAIIGMSQIAAGTEDIAKIRNCLERIENSSSHLLGLINDILDISKIEADKLELDEEEFSLTASVDFAVSMMTSRARERGIHIELEQENVVHDAIVTDQLRLNQVLINLLSNAVKFSNENGKIELKVAELSYEKGYSVYRFSVRDYGIGIDPKAAEKLFRPFEQANTSITRHYGGTGLGLAISKSIVEKMGGEISLESERGRGSTFTFTIRALSSERFDVSSNARTVRSQTGDDGESVDFSGKRILIVDDIDINREILLELLSGTGLAMETAADGKEAVEKVAGTPEGYYNLILMDMQMPVMDGCEATRAIRALVKGDVAVLPIIAMTANVMKDDIKKALDSGMNGHIGKPIEIGKMIELLRETFSAPNGSADTDPLP